MRPSWPPSLIKKKAKLGSSIHPLVLGTRQYALAKNAKNDFRAILKGLEAGPLDYIFAYFWEAWSSTDPPDGSAGSLIMVTRLEANVVYILEATAYWSLISHPNSDQSYI